MSKLKSKIYIIVLVIMLLGYTFFLTSSCIFRKPQSLLISPYGDTAVLSEGVTLTLKKWVYSPEAGTMTVYFTYSSDRLRTKFSVDSHDTHSGYSLPMTVNYLAQGEWLVNLLDVPAGFQEICISVMLDEESNSENDLTMATIAEFYTNKNDVETGVPMANYTDEEYKIEYLNIEKEQKIAEIEEIKERDKQLEEDNKSYAKAIDQLIKDRYYQTTDGINESNRMIENYQGVIDSNNTKIDNDRKTIEEISTEIEEIDKTIQKLKTEGEIE